MVEPDRGQTNRMLGYAPGDRLLFINADDLGMCHAVNEAIAATLKAGIVTSCSLMAPCPWALHAVRWLQATPEVPCGVHLTAISEQPAYRWGPLACSRDVPSLIDEAGYFYDEARMDTFLGRLALGELEQEWRAQIEYVLAAGLRPTHLDSHCSVHVRRPDIFAMARSLARAYGLALRPYSEPYITALRRENYPVNDHPLMDSYEVDVATKPSRYAAMLRALPAGLSEWAVHPGIGDGELQAAMPSWQVRQTDYMFFSSAEAREIIRDEGIILIDYQAIQAYWAQ